MDFGSDQHVIAPPIQRESFSDDPLGFTGCVTVRRVDEIDPAVDGRMQQLNRLVSRRGVDQVVGSEGEWGNERPTAPEAAIFHCH